MKAMIAGYVLLAVFGTVLVTSGNAHATLNKQEKELIKTSAAEFSAKVIEDLESAQLQHSTTALVEDQSSPAKRAPNRYIQKQGKQASSFWNSYVNHYKLFNLLQYAGIAGSTATGTYLFTGSGSNAMLAGIVSSLFGFLLHVVTSDKEPGMANPYFKELAARADEKARLQKDKELEKAFTEEVFTELQRQGIAVPRKNRNAWVNALITAPMQDYILLQNADDVLNEVQRLKSVIPELANQIQDSTKKEVLLGLLEILPEHPGKLIKFFRKRTWLAQSIDQIVRFKRSFANLFYTLGLQVEIKKTVESILYGSGKTTLKAQDKKTEKILNSSDSIFLEPELLELEPKVTLEIKPQLIPSKNAPVGIYVFSGKLDFDSGETVEFRFPFNSRKSELSDVISEGQWKDPLQATLHEKITGKAFLRIASNAPQTIEGNCSHLLEQQEQEELEPNETSKGSKRWVIER